MKHFLILAILTISTSGFAQDKWITSVELDFGFPSDWEYEYQYAPHKFRYVDLEDSGFLLNSFGVQGYHGYFVLKNLSMGAVGGYNYQSVHELSMLRLGARFQLHFADRGNAFTYFQISNNFSLNYEKFKAGPHVRCGLAFPVLREDAYMLSLNLFGELNNYYMGGSKPLLNDATTETPVLLREKSHIGISLGVTF